MKKIHLFFIKTVAILAVLIFFSTARAQQKVPAEWQPGMKLTMSYGGGMRYYSYKVEIKETGSFMFVNDGGKETTYQLAITKKDLADLLRFLREKNFDRIESEMKGMTYDKASESIALSWEGNYIGAAESSAMDIVEKFEADYSAIRIYLDKLIAKVKKDDKR
jgi:hypothetical protein